MYRVEIINQIKDVASDSLIEVFREQIEDNTVWKHLILTEEQYRVLSENLNFNTFKDILISVERYGELDFIHYFDVENMESIKKEGLLTSYSKSNSSNDYIPDMGYGIYVIEGKYPYDMPDNIAELFLSRYKGDENVGYAVGKYKGKYLECINQTSHEGYFLLKEDVSVDSISEVDCEYISALAEDYYNYEFGDIY